MFCDQCNAKLSEQANFCSQCGTAVTQPSVAGSGTGISVDQRVQTNEGQVVGMSAGQGAATGGLNASIKQDIGTVKDSGAVVGAIWGSEGPVHVGGKQHYGDQFQGGKSEVNTGGGDFAGRDQVRGDKVGGDKIAVGNVSGQGIAIGSGAQASVTTGISGAELAALFAPIVQAAQSSAPEQRAQAVQAAEQLQAEVAKGKEADDGKVAGLIEGLVGLAPGAVSAVATAFGSPLLAGIAGPVTSYVLRKLGLKQ